MMTLGTCDALAGRRRGAGFANRLLIAQPHVGIDGSAAASTRPLLCAAQAAAHLVLDHSDGLLGQTHAPRGHAACGFIAPAQSVRIARLQQAAITVQRQLE